MQTRTQQQPPPKGIKNARDSNSNPLQLDVSVTKKSVQLLPTVPLPQTVSLQHPMGMSKTPQNVTKKWNPVSTLDPLNIGLELKKDNERKADEKRSLKPTFKASTPSTAKTKLAVKPATTAVLAPLPATDDDKYFIWKINGRIIKLWSIRELKTYRDTSVATKTNFLHDLPLECNVSGSVSAAMSSAARGSAARGSAARSSVDGLQVLTVGEIIQKIHDNESAFLPLDLAYIKLYNDQKELDDEREKKKDAEADAGENPGGEGPTDSQAFGLKVKEDLFGKPNPTHMLVQRIFSFEIIRGDFLFNIRRTIRNYSIKLDRDALRGEYRAEVVRESGAGDERGLGFVPVEDLIDKIQDERLKRVLKIAYDMWFCMKSFCCVLHDKPVDWVALYIYQIYILDMLLYFRDDEYHFSPDDITWLNGLHERFKMVFVKEFSINPSNKDKPASVTQARCHSAGLEMFDVFNQEMKARGINIPEQEELYKQPYDTYKSQRDAVVISGDDIPDGSIKKIIRPVNGRIFDATKQWFVDEEQFGVYCGKSFSSTDAAPQRSTPEMKRFLFPFTIKVGAELTQRIDIYDQEKRRRISKTIRPIMFGPLAVFADNTGIEDIPGFIDNFITPPSSVKKTRLNFYMPRSILLKKFGSALDEAIRDFKQEARSKRFDLQDDFEVTINGIQYVQVASLRGMLSQNQTAELGQDVIRDIMKSIRGNGCAGKESPELIMLGSKTPKSELLYKYVKGLLSIFGKELGDIAKYEETALLQSAFPSERYDLSTGDWMAGMVTSGSIMVMVENSKVTVVAPRGYLKLSQDTVDDIKIFQQEILHIKPEDPIEGIEEDKIQMWAKHSTRTPELVKKLLTSWVFLKDRADKSWLLQANYITDSLRRLSEDKAQHHWKDILSFVGCLSSIATPSYDADSQSIKNRPVKGLIVNEDRFFHLVGDPFSQLTHPGIFDRGRFMEHVFPSPANIFEIAELRSELSFYTEKITMEQTSARCSSLEAIAIDCFENGKNLSDSITQAPLFWLCDEIIKLAQIGKTVISSMRDKDTRDRIDLTKQMILDQIKATFFDKLKKFIDTYCDRNWRAIYFQKDSSIFCQQLKAIFGDDAYYNTLFEIGVKSSKTDITSDVELFVEDVEQRCDVTCKGGAAAQGGLSISDPLSMSMAGKAHGGSSLSKYTRRHTRFRNHSHTQSRTKRIHLTAKSKKTSRKIIKHSKSYRNRTVKRRKNRRRS